MGNPQTEWSYSKTTAKKASSSTHTSIATKANIYAKTLTPPCASIGPLSNNKSESKEPYKPYQTKRPTHTSPLVPSKAKSVLGLLNSPKYSNTPLHSPKTSLPTLHVSWENLFHDLPIGPDSYSFPIPSNSGKKDPSESINESAFQKINTISGSPTNSTPKSPQSSLPLAPLLLATLSCIYPNSPSSPSIHA